MCIRDSLKAVNEVGSFWGRSPGEGPLLSIDLPEKSSKEGDTLILKYMEFNINAAPSFTQYWSWDEGVITISPNVPGEFIDDDTRKYAKEVTLGRFSTPSLSGKSWEFLTQEATSQALSEVSEALEKKAGKCIAGSIPVVGDIVAAGIDYHQQKKEGEENQKYIEEMYKRLDIADVYSEFDCTAVFVTYETKEYKRTDMNVSEGCTTMERIEAVNQGCDTDITMEELLSSPLSIGEKVEDRRLDYNNAMSEIDAKSQ